MWKFYELLGVFNPKEEKKNSAEFFSLDFFLHSFQQLCSVGYLSPWISRKTVNCVVSFDVYFYCVELHSVERSC